jgi:hypothetical protein
MRGPTSVFWAGLTPCSPKCTFDVTNTNLRNSIGNYMEAMRAFAACADANQEQPGYCHGSTSPGR